MWKDVVECGKAVPGVSVLIAYVMPFLATPPDQRSGAV